jgi:hypothetical protein
LPRIHTTAIRGSNQKRSSVFVFHHTGKIKFARMQSSNKADKTKETLRSRSVPAGSKIPAPPLLNNTLMVRGPVKFEGTEADRRNVNEHRVKNGLPPILDQYPETYEYNTANLRFESIWSSRTVSPRDAEEFDQLIIDKINSSRINYGSRYQIPKPSVTWKPSEEQLNYYESLQATPEHTADWLRQQNERREVVRRNECGQGRMLAIEMPEPAVQAPRQKLQTSFPLQPKTKQPPNAKRDLTTAEYQAMAREARENGLPPPSKAPPEPKTNKISINTKIPTDKEPSGKEPMTESYGANDANYQRLQAPPKVGDRVPNEEQQNEIGETNPKSAKATKKGPPPLPKHNSPLLSKITEKDYPKARDPATGKKCSPPTLPQPTPEAAQTCRSSSNPQRPTISDEQLARVIETNQDTIGNDEDETPSPPSPMTYMQTVQQREQQKREDKSVRFKEAPLAPNNLRPTSSTTSVKGEVSIPVAPPLAMPKRQAAPLHENPIREVATPIAKALCITTTSTKCCTRCFDIPCACAAGQEQTVSLCITCFDIPCACKNENGTEPTASSSTQPIEEIPTQSSPMTTQSTAEKASTQHHADPDGVRRERDAEAPKSAGKTQITPQLTEEQEELSSSCGWSSQLPEPTPLVDVGTVKEWKSLQGNWYSKSGRPKFHATIKGRQMMVKDGPTFNLAIDSSGKLRFPREHDEGAISVIIDRTRGPDQWELEFSGYFDRWIKEEYNKEVVECEYCKKMSHLDHYESHLAECIVEAIDQRSVVEDDRLKNSHLLPDVMKVFYLKIRRLINEQTDAGGELQNAVNFDKLQQFPEKAI